VAIDLVPAPATVRGTGVTIERKRPREVCVLEARALLIASAQSRADRRIVKISTTVRIMDTIAVEMMNMITSALRLKAMGRL
jgi:hypothetical protein